MEEGARWGKPQGSQSGRGHPRHVIQRVYLAQSTMPAGEKSSRAIGSYFASSCCSMVDLWLWPRPKADWVAKAAFLLVWALLNSSGWRCFRRPAVAALLSLESCRAYAAIATRKFERQPGCDGRAGETAPARRN